jgi:hypothetical protein
MSKPRKKLDEATEEMINNLVADMRSLGILRITRDFLMSESAETEVWMATFDGNREKYTRTEKEFYTSDYDSCPGPTPRSDEA